jgi:hypothetical protein
MVLAPSIHPSQTWQRDDVPSLLSSRWHTVKLRLLAMGGVSWSSLEPSQYIYLETSLSRRSSPNHRVQTPGSRRRARSRTQSPGKWSDIRVSAGAVLVYATRSIKSIQSSESTLKTISERTSPMRLISVAPWDLDPRYLLATSYAFSSTMPITSGSHAQSGSKSSCIFSGWIIFYQ